MDGVTDISYAIQVSESEKGIAGAQYKNYRSNGFHLDLLKPIRTTRVKASAGTMALTLFASIPSLTYACPIPAV